MKPSRRHRIEPAHIIALRAQLATIPLIDRITRNKIRVAIYKEGYPVQGSPPQLSCECGGKLETIIYNQMMCHKCRGLMDRRAQEKQPEAVVNNLTDYRRELVKYGATVYNYPHNIHYGT